jgi:hypothetical protein
MLTEMLRTVTGGGPVRIPGHQSIGKGGNMRRVLFLGVVALVVVAAFAAVSQPARAQGEPVPIVVPSCQDLARYDLNRDGRVGPDDFSLWVITVHELGGEQCRLNGPVQGCPSWLDVNHDGIVSHADLDAMSFFMANCVYPRTRVMP